MVCHESAMWQIVAASGLVEKCSIFGVNKSWRLNLMNLGRLDILTLLHLGAGYGHAN